MDPLLVATLGGVLRTVLAAGVSYCAAKGYIGGDASGDLIAALTTLGVAGWSAFQKRTTVPAAEAAKTASLASVK
jgi:hypothetical protein